MTFYSKHMDLHRFVWLICLMCPFYSFSGTYGSLVFSELMVDPEPAVGLPEVEYLEIYNRSDQTVSLHGWTLCYGEKSYGFPDCSIDSAGFCLLCSKKAAILFPSGIFPVAFESFPILANTGQLISLKNEHGELITCLEYSDDWYKNEFKAKGGWSLECIDLDNLSGNSSNWNSSSNLNGGTPGYVNSVSAIYPDDVVPICTGIFVPASDRIELIFSKTMQPDNLAAIANYEISPKTTLVSAVLPLTPPYRSVVFMLSDTLESGIMYQLSLSNLTDISGLSLPKVSIPFGLPEVPSFFDLSLNEVLFNPAPNGSDYVEFVNISEKCIDLSQVWLTNQSASGSLDKGVRLSEKPLPCVPGSYWLLSANIDSHFFINNGSNIQNEIYLSEFPSMPDTSGHLLLLTTSAQIVDEMTYKESMHFPLISSCEGVSLEKLNPKLKSLEEASWRSASSASGYGTPGVVNSQYRDLSDMEEDGFSIQNKWITPDNDGLDDYLTIYYRVKDSGLANLTIFDLEGRVVKFLAKNELLASEGFMYWDGTKEDGELVSFGRYILQTDYFTSSGHRNKKRFVLTVLF